MHLYGYVFVELLVSVPFSETSTWLNMLCSRRLMGAAVESSTRFALLFLVIFARTYSMTFDRSIYLFSRSYHAEFDRCATQNISQWLIFDPFRLLNARLCRWDCENIQFRLDALASKVRDEGHHPNMSFLFGFTTFFFFFFCGLTDSFRRSSDVDSIADGR